MTENERKIEELQMEIDDLKKIIGYILKKLDKLKLKVEKEQNKRYY
jgi:predicted RNase H-like nuclease (RuvC/YqgF family)